MIRLEVLMLICVGTVCHAFSRPPLRPTSHTLSIDVMVINHGGGLFEGFVSDGEIEHDLEYMNEAFNSCGIKVTLRQRLDIHGADKWWVCASRDLPVLCFVPGNFVSHADLANGVAYVSDYDRVFGTAKRSVAAHELGHLVADPSHYFGPEYNLMSDVRERIAPVLNEKQCLWALGSRWVN